MWSQTWLNLQKNRASIVFEDAELSGELDSNNAAKIPPVMKVVPKHGKFDGFRIS